MQPGVEMVVELDRTDVIPETDGSQLRIPATGRMALDVVALETFDLKIVPIAFGSDVTGRNDKVASLAEDLAGDDSRGALPPPEPCFRSPRWTSPPGIATSPGPTPCKTGLPRYLCSRTGPQPGSPACALRWPLGCRPTVSLFQREYRGLGLRIRVWRGPWASAESGRVPGPHVLLRAGGCQRLQLHAGIGLPARDCGLGIGPASGRGSENPVAMGIHP